MEFLPENPNIDESNKIPKPLEWIFRPHTEGEDLQTTQTFRYSLYERMKELSQATESLDQPEINKRIEKITRLVKGLDNLHDYIFERDKELIRQSKNTRQKAWDIEQLAAIKSIVNFFEDCSISQQHTPQNAGYVNLPTGTGKTRIMNTVLQVTGWKYRWLTPTNLLKSQTAGTVYQESDEIGTYQGEISKSKSRYRDEYLDSEFDIYVLDEAHTILGIQTREIISSLKNDGFLIVGVTASPAYNESTRSLKSVLEKPIHERTIIEMIRNGILPSLESFHINFITPPDKDRLNTIAEIIVENYTRHFRGERGLVTANTIEDCKFLSQKFASMFKSKLNSQFDEISMPIWGAMNSNEGIEYFIKHHPKFIDWTKEQSDRLSINNLQQLVLKFAREGKVAILTGVKSLMEGYDDPNITFVINTKPPIESRVKATQSPGRALRWPESSKLPVAILEFNEFNKNPDGSLRPVQKKPMFYNSVLEAQNNGLPLNDDLGSQSRNIEVQVLSGKNYQIVKVASIANPYTSKIERAPSYAYPISGVIERIFGEPIANIAEIDLIPKLMSQRKKSGRNPSHTFSIDEVKALFEECKRIEPTQEIIGFYIGKDALKAKLNSLIRVRSEDELNRLIVAVRREYPEEVLSVNNVDIYSEFFYERINTILSNRIHLRSKQIITFSQIQNDYSNANPNSEESNEKIIEEFLKTTTDESEIYISGQNEIAEFVSYFLKKFHQIDKSSSRLRKEAFKEKISRIEENLKNAAVTELKDIFQVADPQNQLIDFFSQNSTRGTQISISDCRILSDIIAYGYFGIDPTNPVMFMTRSSMAEELSNAFGYRKKSILQLFERMIADGRIVDVNLDGTGRNVVFTDQYTMFVNYIIASQDALNNNWIDSKTFYNKVRSRIEHRKPEDGEIISVLTEIGKVGLRPAFVMGNQILHDPSDVDLVVAVFTNN